MQHSKNAQLLKFNPTHKLRTLQTASPSEARVPAGYKPRDILLHWYLGRSITTKFYGAQKARTDCKSVDNLTDDYNIKVSSLLFQGLETRPAPSARLMPSSNAEGFRAKLQSSGFSTSVYKEPTIQWVFRGSAARKDRTIAQQPHVDRFT